MFKGVERVINNAIDKVLKEFDFENWWKDDFETDIDFETEEEFKTLDEDDLETVKADWIYWMIGYNDSILAIICEELGISTTIGDTKCHDELIEELWEVVRDKLYQAISD